MKRICDSQTSVRIRNASLNTKLFLQFTAPHFTGMEGLRAADVTESSNDRTMAKFRLLKYFVPFMRQHQALLSFVFRKRRYIVTCNTVAMQ
jgi:hypothetical protein